MTARREAVHCVHSISLAVYLSRTSPHATARPCSTTTVSSSVQLAMAFPRQTTTSWPQTSSQLKTPWKQKHATSFPSRSTAVPTTSVSTFQSPSESPSESTVAGYLKQPVYACSTCLNSSGVCAGCSIACHGYVPTPSQTEKTGADEVGVREHELHELFNRRDFRCDCGTSRMGAGSCCTITKRDDALPNSENKVRMAFGSELRRD